MTYNPNIDFTQVLKQAFDNDAQGIKTIALGQLVPKQYDTIQLSYSGSDLTQVVYKSAGVTVATLTLTYSSGLLSQVVRS